MDWIFFACQYHLTHTTCKNQEKFREKSIPLRREVRLQDAFL